MPGAHAITTRPLARDDWPRVEALFGPNGACGGCWCMHWRRPVGGKAWDAVKGAPNREAFRTLVERGAASGVLAFDGADVAGWCAVGPRADFPRVERSKVLARDWDAGTWSLNCFYVPARRRGRGVATALAAGAVALARARGAREVEAYPQSGPAGKPQPAAFAWTGVPALFERLGFRPVHAPERGRGLWLLGLEPAPHGPAGTPFAAPQQAEP